MTVNAWTRDMSGPITTDKSASLEDKDILRHIAFCQTSGYQQPYSVRASFDNEFGHPKKGAARYR